MNDKKDKMFKRLRTFIENVFENDPNNVGKESSINVDDFIDGTLNKFAIDIKNDKSEFRKKFDHLALTELEKALTYRLLTDLKAAKEEARKDAVNEVSGLFSAYAKDYKNLELDLMRTGKDAMVEILQTKKQWEDELNNVFPDRDNEDKSDPLNKVIALYTKDMWSDLATHLAETLTMFSDAQQDVYGTLSNELSGALLEIIQEEFTTNAISDEDVDNSKSNEELNDNNQSISPESSDLEEQPDIEEDEVESSTVKDASNKVQQDSVLNEGAYESETNGESTEAKSEKNSEDDSIREAFENIGSSDKKDDKKP